MRQTGAALLILVAVASIAAPVLAPNDPNIRFPDLLNAPPTCLHILGGDGPYIYAQRLISRRERSFEDDRSRPVPLRFLTNGRLFTTGDNAAPLLLFGADSYGRDVFARLIYGGRATLAVALIATLGAACLGALIGGISGQASGWIDAALSRVSEFVLVLPTMYVALALRAVMPLILPAPAVFLLLTGIFTLLGWPIVARGVRAIVLAERERDYVLAARAAGAGPLRLLVHHLLPSAHGYVRAQASLLLPAFILAEATMSFVGLGFPADVATWGTMLQEASNVALLPDAPWVLAPAVAIFVVVLGVNIVLRDSRTVTSA